MQGYKVTLWIEMDTDSPTDHPQKWDWDTLIGESVAYVRTDDWDGTLSTKENNNA